MRVNNKVNNTFILRAIQIIAYRNGIDMKSGPGKGAAGRQCDRKQLVGQELRGTLILQSDEPVHKELMQNSESPGVHVSEWIPPQHKQQTGDGMHHQLRERSHGKRSRGVFKPEPLSRFASSIYWQPKRSG